VNVFEKISDNIPFFSKVFLTFADLPIPHIKRRNPMKTLNASEYQKLLTPKYIAIEAFGIVSFFSALVWHFS